MNNHILRNALVTFVSFIFVITIVSAWTAPSMGTTPPANNVSGPITVSITNQEKFGGLWLGSLVVSGDSLFGGNVGVGTVVPPAERLDVNGNVKATAFFYASDSRMKENIVPLTNSLDKVRLLNGYNFQWKESGQKDIGVIAQEIEVQFPDIVHTNEYTGMKSVEYGNLVAPLIESIKELSVKVDEQALEIQVLQTKIKTLESVER